jgi:hypothetical protein
VAIARIQQQVLDSIQSDEEVQKFSFDFTFVRLAYFKDSEAASGRASGVPIPLPSVDWTDRATLLEVGIEPEWVIDAKSREHYVHRDYLSRENWPLLQYYLERACLTDKQRRSLFPVLSRVRPQAGGGDAAALEEVRRLNTLLHFVAELGLDYRAHTMMLKAIGTHSGWQNLSGEIGMGGAVIAVLDALRELGITVADVTPPAFCRGGFTNGAPIEFYRRYKSDASRWRPQAILLENGRAVLFKADPDVAIIQPLGSCPFESAIDAVNRYEAVRRDLAGRRRFFHEHAVGEVKTALDPSNLFERVALAGREDQAEIRTVRFLVMAILPEQLMQPTRDRRRRQQSVVDRLGQRFNNIFNLYFVWNYDGVRLRHADHWSRFKAQMEEWCR